jgi:glycosyltransferase involved in cell wall biosynthesis
MQGRGRQSLVNPKDTEAFSRRLGLLLDDQVLRQAWLDWAQKYVQQFDYPRVIDKYESLYKQILKKAQS